MPQFPGYNSAFGGAPAGAARNPAAGGYPSAARSPKGRPGRNPFPTVGANDPIRPGPMMTTPDFQPLPVGGPRPMPPGYPSPIAGGPGDTTLPQPGDPGYITVGPDLPPGYEWASVGMGPPQMVPSPGAPGYQPRPAPPPGSRPGPGPMPGLSDIPKSQILMQLAQARRARMQARRQQPQTNPYGPGYDWAGYPIPPPGMAGPV